ncbi:hypothetical protein ACFL0S_03640 [Thermodesulfobacteriota bacterium]
MDQYFGQSHKSTVLSWFTLGLCLLGCLYYFFFFFNRAFVEVEIEVEQKSQLKIYWADKDQSFSEKRRSSIRISPGAVSYGFFLTNLSGVDRLRFDPMQHPGKATISRVAISQTGYEPFTVPVENLQPAHEIINNKITENGLGFESSGVDPYFLISPQINKSGVNWGIEIVRYLLICSLVIILVRGCAAFRKNFAFVPMLLSMVIMLIITMASISKRNAHPDEYVHLQAAEYYQDHWLPPQIDSKEIENTYSAYGISRLNNGEIYYLLAGKFSKLLEGLKIDRLLALRSFNILLFGLILVYTVKSVSARLVALPFLLSPQVWYIFSYCVSDAFGLFLCFLMGCELVRKNSFLNRVLDVGKSTSARAMILFSVLLALLFLLKINYYPFIVLVYCVIFWRWLHQHDGRTIIFTRIFACSLMALMVASIRMGADYYVNGADRNEKLAVMQEKTAHHWYKPSTELNKKHVSMYMKERGTTLKALLVKHNWFAHSFQTGFGKYGYFTISGSETYYRLVKWSVIVFLVFLGGAVAFRGDTEGRLLALLVCGLALVLVAASVHRSWTIDFQAQGRYLFPILPMIGVVLARNRSVVDNKVFILLTMQLFLLSLYSFIFIALPAIPRS